MGVTAMPLYRLFVALVWGPAALVLLVRVLSGREGLRDWAERTGLSLGRAEGPHLWLHAASNGELMSARPVLMALRAARPDLKLLITTNSLTGRNLARDWAMGGLTARLAPLDTRWAAAGLIRRYDLRAHVLLEAEFWPNRIFAFADRDLPVHAVGARLSRRTATSWRRLAGLAARMLARMSFVSPQDEGSRRRLLQLGLDPRRMGPVLDLKAFYTPPPDMTPDPDLAAAFDRHLTWLAASTHPGEDEIVLAAHLRVLEDYPAARLIIAPRHPKRGPEVAAMVRASGLGAALRSAGDSPRAEAVYIADTLGEMPLWYKLAGATFVGGSLVEKGGHTPFEPAVFDSILLHGPDTSNFTRIYRRLDVAGAAIQVSNARTLAEALVQLRDPDRRRAMRRLAREQLDQPADLEAVVGRILAGLDP